MNYEIFLQGPEVYIPIILVSLVITILAYGAFPIIFAKIRRKNITKKQYNIRCYGINLLVMFVFCVINGEASSGGAYLLWTWIFTSVGLKTLQNKGVLEGYHVDDKEDPMYTHPVFQSADVTSKMQETTQTSGVSDQCHQVRESDVCSYKPQVITYQQSSKGDKTFKVLLWVMVVLVAACLGVALYQNYSMRNQLDTLLVENNELKNTVSEQKTTISKNLTAISNLQKKADNFNDMCDSLQYGNIGTAAYNFKADESIIVVRKNETDRQFTLTAHWGSGGTVSVSYSSNAASVDFDKDSWSSTVKMTVNPRNVGATVVTFSNDVNSDKFKILIIVTE